MERSNSTTILAAFATMKSLFDDKTYQSQYQLLAEFIQNIIRVQKLHTFTAYEMKDRLMESFGFDIPEAVVKTSIRSIDYVRSENNGFVVTTNNTIDDAAFEEKQQTAKKSNISIIEMLTDYIKVRNPSIFISQENLTQDLIAFLIDDSSKSAGNGYTELISQFILSHENDEVIQSILTSIREGSILYLGLNLNLNETGRLRKPITLYLGTEVLFSLLGLNGEIHKKLALDLYTQIRFANSKQKKINLTYFHETKREIDDFFSSARTIVDGGAFLYDTVAMRAIVNGCSSASDVVVKQSDFFHALQYSYGIIEDEYRDYYSVENQVYNLETIEETDPQIKDSLKLVSHINVLRKGQVFASDFDSEYLLVTNTSNTIRISKEQSERDKNENAMEYVSNYAVSVDRMTNLLWYKLGNGFGKKGYPSNVNAVLKARTILASNISRNIARIYNDTKLQYVSGEITEEQLAARIVTLKRKPTIPEELNRDTIEESMDFSLDYLTRFEEEILNNKRALAEKDKMIQTLEELNIQKLDEKNATIAEKDQKLTESEEEKKQLRDELRQYKEKEEKRNNKKRRFKNILRFVWSIIWKLLIVAGLTYAAILICRRIDPNSTTIVSTVIDVLGLLIIGYNAIKSGIDKYLK